MPTGYNAKICEGEQTFEEFVWDAVRAVGAFMHMRDDHFDAKLYLPGSEVDQSKADKIAKRAAAVREEERELRDLRDMTAQQITRRFDQAKKKARQEYEETYAQKKPVHDRLMHMRARVADWVPPTKGHESFKEFLIQQLDSGLYWEGELPIEPKFPPTAKEWHKQQIADAELWLARTKELLEEERNRPDSKQETIEFIKALVKSVPPPDGRFTDEARRALL